MFRKIQTYWEKSQVIRELGTFDDHTVWLAVEDQQVNCLEILLKCGKSANYIHSSGIPVLIKAVMVGHPQMVELLIKAQADVNASGPNGITPIIQAVKSGSLPIFNLILQSHPELERVDHSGENAIFHAAKSGKTSMVKKLIDAGAEVDGVNEMGVTPLMMAVQHNRITISRQLLEAGADPARPMPNGTPIFQHPHLSPRLSKLLNSNRSGSLPAQENGVMQLLSDINQLNPSSINLDLASEKGQSLIKAWEQRLAQTILDPLTLPTEWLKPLVLSLAQIAKLGPSPLIDQILRIGEPYGISAYQLAKMIGFQLEESSEKESLDQDRTASIDLDETFLEAVKQEKPQLVELLINLGAKVNFQDTHGRTALHFAVHHQELVELLLKNGANPNLKDRKGESPKQKAKKAKLPHIIRLMDNLSSK
ncbi:ankyrin repeat domain-containing protein [Pontibacter sp. G13]|uniref:ankyrin repeat domain-containing protein n=1 Tax=Pontibacter sp. G13 TaxID=3074898 RepID=UPI00288B3A32|nr:ankyrin repeat domain-containing protein [Pontibacter sp. G13]WNJ15934.1 ankyrin repeat domain-containing protein [Pontibacter sp. G13]